MIQKYHSSNNEFPKTLGAANNTDLSFELLKNENTEVNLLKIHVSSVQNPDFATSLVFTDITSGEIDWVIEELKRIQKYL